jgi:hypothetical protein
MELTASAEIGPVAEVELTRSRWENLERALVLLFHDEIGIELTAIVRYRSLDRIGDLNDDRVDDFLRHCACAGSRCRQALRVAPRRSVRYVAPKRAQPKRPLNYDVECTLDKFVNHRCGPYFRNKINAFTTARAVMMVTKNTGGPMGLNKSRIQNRSLSIERTLDQNEAAGRSMIDRWLHDAGPGWGQIGWYEFIRPCGWTLQPKSLVKLNAGTEG